MKVLLHIPHSSLKVPKKFYKGLLISREEFQKYNLKMTDVGIDELFKEVKGYKYKAKYSRLYCDVEKYKDNSKEFMYKYGQGVIYTKTYDGKDFHINDDKYKKKVYKYYDKYHYRLDKLALKLLKKDRKLLIIDCHSYSTEMALYHHSGDFKDICIGIEKDFYNEEVLKKIIQYIESKGLTYEINSPYIGSLVPNVFFNKKYNGEVISIMIEVNKRIYL